VCELSPIVRCTNRLLDMSQVMMEIG